MFFMSQLQKYNILNFPTIDEEKEDLALLSTEATAMGEAPLMREGESMVGGLCWGEW